MALEHLDSIFTENLSALAEDYQANQALNTGDTMMVPNISLPTETPILDEFSRLPSSFIGVPSSFGYTPASDLPAFMTLDVHAIRNLEIFENTYDRGSNGKYVLSCIKIIAINNYSNCCKFSFVLFRKRNVV